MRLFTFLCSLGFACFFVSCGMYRSHFDCPPGQGIGCQPVSEVLNLIIEREEGEDLFAADAQTAHLLKKKKQGRNHEEKKTLYLLKEHSGDPVLVEGSP